MTETKEMTARDESKELTPLQSAPLAGDAVPQRVLLAPWGNVESTNGSFIIDDDSARMTIEAFDEHGTDLPIDYEHQTLGGAYSSPNGQAPAAGWIKKLLAEPGVGLLAEIQWTDQAKALLANKEYRYLSPVAIIRKHDRKLAAIHSAALTNKPAIVGMRPIVNIAGAVSREPVGEPLTLLKTELDLPEDALPEQVLMAASERLMDLRREAQQHHVDQRIREAVRAGKLVEAQRGWAEALVAKEEQLFDEWLRTAPIIVQPGATVAPSESGGPERRHRAIAAKARGDFRANGVLAGLTTEEAYVTDALREAG
ncbi:MAG: phage protease [Phycisphaerae bacterium]|jgi:phage I-like protein